MQVNKNSEEVTDCGSDTTERRSSDQTTWKQKQDTLVSGTPPFISLSLSETQKLISKEEKKYKHKL